MSVHQYGVAGRRRGYVYQAALLAITGERIQYFRESGNCSRRGLANLTGMGREADVRDVEEGRQGVGIVTLYRIADALQCDPHDLAPTVDEMMQWKPPSPAKPA